MIAYPLNSLELVSCRHLLGANTPHSGPINPRTARNFSLEFASQFSMYECTYIQAYTHR